MVTRPAFGSLALTDASAALFLAFGDRRRRHRARSDGHIGCTKGRPAHGARLALGQSVRFVGARNQRPSGVVIPRVCDNGRRHLPTVSGPAEQRCSLLHITHSCRTTLRRAALIFSFLSRAAPLVSVCAIKRRSVVYQRPRAQIDATHTPPTRATARRPSMLGTTRS